MKKVEFSKFAAYQPEEEDMLNPTRPPGYVYTALELVKMNLIKILMLIEGLIPKVGLWAIVGASDIGKSMLFRQIVMCVVGGIPFLGKHIKATHGRAIIVSSEDDATAMSALVIRQNQTMQLNDEQLERLRFVFDFDEETVVDKLEKMLKEQPADLVVIDAFGDVFDGKNSSDSAQVRPFLNKFTQLAIKYQCSIGFLHHTGKRTEALAPSKNNAAGSQAFEAKMRLLLELRADHTDPDLRHLCPVKGNYMPAEEKNSSYALRMDENLVFVPTGERVPFDQLAADAGKNGKKQRKTPTEFTDDEHFAFLRAAIKKGGTVSQTLLREKVEAFFEVSDQPARKFIRYYETQEYIKDESMKANKRDYRLTEKVPPALSIF